MSFARLVVSAFFALLATMPAVAQDDDWAYPPHLDWADRWQKASAAHIAWKTTLKNEPCCAAAPKGKQPYPEEAAILQQLDGKAARDDETLRLAIDGGRTLEITDCVDAEVQKCVETESRLVGWWPAFHYYLVEVGLPGIFDVYLISEKDGSVTSVGARPTFSPSGHYAIAFLSSPVLGVRLDIIDLTTEPPKTVSVARPTCAGVERDSLLRPNPVWTDEWHVRFEGEPNWPGYTGGQLYTGKQVLRIGPGRPQWEC
jgi:hypothetical protein